MIVGIAVVGGVLAGTSLIRRRKPRLVEVIRKSRSEADPLRVDRQYLQVSGLATASSAVAVLYPPVGLMGLALLGYGIEPLLARAGRALRRDRRLNNDAYATLVALLSVGIGQYFAAGMHLMIYHLGVRLVAEGKQGAEARIGAAFRGQSNRVWTLRQGVEIETPMEEIRAGDLLVVHAGEVITIAGTIVEGRAWIDQQALTGETLPVVKGEGDEVAISTLVRGGEITLRAALGGAESRAQGLDQVLKRTCDFKDQLSLRGEAWSDRVAAPMIGISSLTWLAAGATPATALLFGAPMNSIRATLALQTSAHLRWAADHGILVKDGRVLEELPRVDTILFDKTGTLTEHTPEVAAVRVFGEADEARLLALAAAAEGHVTHPVADAIRGEALARGVAIPDVERIEYDLGAGVRARIDGRSLHLGSVGYMNALAIELPHLLSERIVAHPQHTYILLAIDGVLSGAIELRVRVREEAAEVIAALRGLGKTRLAMVSGDTRHACEGIGKGLGIDEIHAEINPDGKAALIRALQQQGRRVCFVGDGLNDAVAMKQANVSICMSDGANLTGNVAHIQLTQAGLTALPGAFRFGLGLQHRLDMSLRYWLAFGGVNTLAVPLLAFTPLQSSLLYAVAFGSAYHHVRRPVDPQESAPPQEWQSSKDCHSSTFKRRRRR